MTAWRQQLLELSEQDRRSAARANEIVRRLHARQDGAEFVEGMLNALEDQQPTPASWPTLRRAEHMVADVDATNAATVHGTYPVERHRLAGWVEALAADRMARLIGRFPLLEVGVGDHFANGGIAQLPTFTSVPEAGPQAGQKKEAPSNSFVVGPDTAATVIDAALFLNVSMQLEVAARGVVEQLMRLAVVAEAERQIVADIEAKATAGGADVGTALGTFTGGLYSPALLVLPTGALIDQSANINALTAVGIAVALSPFSTTPVVLDPSAVTGYLVELSLDAVEPSMLGRAHSEQLYGQVSVAAAGAASFTAA